MLKNIRSAVKRQFFTGIALLLPLGLTLYVGWILFNLVGKVFLPFVEKNSFLSSYDLPPLCSKGISFAITLVIIWIIGVIGANIVGRKFLQLLEVLIVKVPLLDSIYQAIRQIIHAMIFSKTAFRQVVMIEYPRKGIYTLAFVTNSYQGKEEGKGKILTLFIPTTPNPTSGWFLIIPEEEVMKIDLPVEEGMKVIISGGVITPDRFFERLEIGGKRKE
ncbi:DUF502 domain-containing protein [bacterium]|nr:DUF502 domain-containing protein [bacterium]